MDATLTTAGEWQVAFRASRKIRWLIRCLLTRGAPAKLEGEDLVVPRRSIPLLTAYLGQTLVILPGTAQPPAPGSSADGPSSDEVWGEGVFPCSVFSFLTTSTIQISCLVYSKE